MLSKSVDILHELHNYFDEKNIDVFITPGKS